jgi:dolichol-phosphate mannosyltransferase
MGGILEPFLDDVLRALEPNYKFYEIILVDDGSTDSTPAVVEQLLKRYQRVRYLRLSRRFGSEVAISAGLDSSIGDFTVVVSPESDPCEMIPELILAVRRSGGILTGVTKTRKKRSGPAQLAASAFHYYSRRHLGIDLKENSTDFRVMSRQAVNAITQIKDRRRHLRLFTNTIGYDLQYFDYTPINRTGRTERTHFLDEVSQAIDLIVTTSPHPLRFASRLGLIASVLNALYIAYIVGVYIFKPHVAEGWITTSMAISVMFLFLFVLLAILCEYVGRLLEEVQGRPLYFIGQEKNSSVLLEHQVKGNVVNVSTERV